MWLIYSILIVLSFSLFEFLSAGIFSSSPYLYAICSLYISIGYLLKYRRNHLLCFELFFLLVYNLTSFFNLIVSADDLSRLYFSFSDNIIYKTYIVTSIGLCFFLLGCIFANRKVASSHMKNDVVKIKLDFNTRLSANLMSYIVLLYIIYLYITKQYIILFKYVDSSQIDSAITVIVYLTILMLATSILEISRLRKLQCFTFRAILKNINKLYFLEVISITLLFFFTGNRNEAILIILPAIILFDSLLIPMSNKVLLLGASAAFLFNIVIGLTRSGDAYEGFNNISFYEYVRDFSSTGLSNMYLIQYADDGHINYGLNGLVELFSSVPFLGGVIVELFDIQTMDRSALLTTKGMLGVNAVGGMGTGLVGDLYHTGLIYMVIIWMFLIGFLLAYLYANIYILKKSSIYTMAIYSYMVANSIYYIRSEWYTPFRYIGFTIIILFILSHLFKTKRI